MKPAPSEKESRANLINWARQFGCEVDLLKIFARYDDLLKGCKNEQDRAAVSAMGIVEIHQFFGGRSTDDLIINGKKIQ